MPQVCLLAAAGRGPGHAQGRCEAFEAPIRLSDRKMHYAKFSPRDAQWYCPSGIA